MCWILVKWGWIAGTGSWQTLSSATLADTLHEPPIPVPLDGAGPPPSLQPPCEPLRMGRSRSTSVAWDTCSKYMWSIPFRGLRTSYWHLEKIFRGWYTSSWCGAVCLQLKKEIMLNIGNAHQCKQENPQWSTSMSCPFWTSSMWEVNNSPSRSLKNALWPAWSTFLMFGWDITLTDLHQPSGTVSSEVNTNSSISLILDSSYHLFVRNLLELQGTCSWWTALVKDSWLSSSYSVLFVSKHQWTLKPKAPLDIPRFVKSRGWIETFAALVTCIRTAHDAKLRIPCDGHHCSLIFARHMSDCTQRRLTKANKKASSKWGNRHCEYIIAYKKGLRTPIFIFINFFNSSTTAGT